MADQTRQLVIDTAHKMGYAPDRAARQLRRQKAETIGFILPANAPHFSEPFFTELIAGLGSELASRNYDLLGVSYNSQRLRRSHGHDHDWRGHH